MEITNVTEFRNFVQQHGLQGKNGDVDTVITCMSEYERACNCWNGSTRQKLYNNCKILYLRAMGAVTGPMAAHFLAHAEGIGITFYQDGVSIGSVRR